MEVIIDGVRYVPDGNQVEFEYLSLHYMHDNHTFSRIQGTTLDEIKASAYKLGIESRCGMLCPPCIVKKFIGADRHKEKSHGIKVHSPYKMDEEKWMRDVELWMVAMSSDEEVMRLIDLGKINQSSKVIGL